MRVEDNLTRIIGSHSQSDILRVCWSYGHYTEIHCSETHYLLRVKSDICHINAILAMHAP